SLGNISWQQMSFIAPLLLGTIAASFLLNKSLNMLLMGENYAKSMGINLKKTKFIIILVTCMLVAVCTAFVGPIAFVGLAVPHITRMIRSEEHTSELQSREISYAVFCLKKKKRIEYSQYNQEYHKIIRH